MKDTRTIIQYISAYLLQEEITNIPPELEEWINECEDNRLNFEAYRKMWDEIHNIYAMKRFDANAAWIKVSEANHHKAIHGKRKLQILYAVSAIAASILLFVSLSTFDILRTSTKLAGTIAMETEYGSRSQVTLPDGTQVRLNVGSKISYAFNSKDNIREVDFSGEGFFEVSKNQTPFIITTSDGIQLKVLGTTFNLSAYQGDETIETTLIEGAVEMSLANRTLVLKPGETGSYHKTTHTLQSVDKITSHTYGWLNDKIYLDDMPLAELCKLLERQYDVSIILYGDIGESIRYNGVVHEKSIVDVLDVLQKLSKITYQMKGKNISITSK